MWKPLQGEGGWDGEVIGRRRNGELYPKHVAISVVRNEQGDITNYVAAFSDITERKRAEEEARASRLERAAERGPDGLKT